MIWRVMGFNAGIFLGAFALLSSGMPGALADTVYDPAASFEAGWTSQSDPNAVWSYGYSSNYTSSITLYNSQETGPDSPNEQFWINPSVNCCAASPSVGYNNGSAFNDGNVAAAANSLILVSSVYQGLATDLVFTAPTSGTYSLNSSFTGDQYNIGVNVAVVNNSAILFQSSVNSIGQVVPYITTLTLNQGDTVRFAVEQGGGAQNTGFSATIIGPSGSSSPVLPNAVDIASGGPANDVYVATSYANTAPATTVSYQNLEVLPGGSYMLGVGDTVDLNNGTGTLYVDKGGVFTGNGTVEGNVVNSGLVRIPLAAISQVYGGFVQPQQTSPGVFSGGGTINTGTYASFGTGGTITGSAPVVTGTVGFTAKLTVTGNYTQTSTGALRLFVGGHDQGNSYSWLDVDQALILDGTVEVVLQPDMFEANGYQPEAGDEFDFITGLGGITLSPDLNYEFFVTSADLAYLTGFDLVNYDSGINSDPDSLYQIIDPNLFSFALIDGGTVLEATLNQALSTAASVPEPDSFVLLSIGLAGLGLIAVMRISRSRGRSTDPDGHELSFARRIG